MNYWTNIQVPSRFGTDRQRREYVSELEFKLSQKDIEIEHLYKELENIFVALKSGSEVTLSYEKEKIEGKFVTLEMFKSEGP